MAGTKVVVVGDAMLDVYLVGEVDRVSPEAPVPVVTVHASRHGLGGAANVAANVAALGAECRLVAVVGNDARATAVRTEALLESGMFRAGLDSGFDQWDLVNAVMASGWIAITYPELLCDQKMNPGAAFVGQPSMRREILERHPDLVARDAQALVQLLESRVTQLESNYSHAERSAFHIKRPRDFFGLTPEQQFRAVRKIIRNPRMGFNFMIYHTKISLQKFGNRIWNTIPGRRTNDR